jgi:hypothetical protein
MEGLHLLDLVTCGDYTRIKASSVWAVMTHGVCQAYTLLHGAAWRSCVDTIETAKIWSPSLEHANLAAVESLYVPACCLGTAVHAFVTARVLHGEVGLDYLLCPEEMK